MTHPDDRTVVHLTPESLDTYFESGVPTNHRLCAGPRCDLLIDPVAQTYELFTPQIGPEPDLTGMRHVHVDTVTDPDGPLFRLRVDARDHRHEAYGFLVAVVQAVQCGMSFAAATSAALANLRVILASRHGLSPEQEIGLLGELLVVSRLLDDHPEQEVIEWWLGPLAEQHDLALPDSDVEVKTTKSERRIHVIHGTGQLQPNPGRPLWLLSVQVTRAGGAHGVSLTALIDEVRSRLSARRDRFRDHLVGLGWREEDDDLYRTRFLLRSAPLAYPVDDDFPAVTDARLAASVPHVDLVSDVSYRVDVTARTPRLPGGPLGPFLNDPRPNSDGDDV